MLIPKIGQYAKFKDEYYLVVDFDSENNLIKLLNPKNNKKLNCKSENVRLTKHICVQVNYEGTDYLISLAAAVNDKVIVSLKTNRVMKWTPSNGHRKAILDLELGL